MDELLKRFTDIAPLWAWAAFLWTVFSLPAIVGLGTVLHYYSVIYPRLSRANRRGGRRAVEQLGEQKKLYPHLIRDQLMFTLRDSRDIIVNGEPVEGVSRQIVFLTLFFSSTVSLVATIMLDVSPWFFATPPVLAVLSLIYGYNNGNPIITARRERLEKMASVIKLKIGRPDDPNIKVVDTITVLEWANLVTPTKIAFMLPIAFNREGERGFLREFNRIFGAEMKWVPNDNFTTGEIGFDYPNSIATLRTTPPLPTLATWKEHYILGSGVPKTYFPVMIGTEGGLELEDPETGEIEHVIGFDLSGTAQADAKRKGLTLHPNIVQTPMVLIGGRTGGGKALDVNTKVLVKKRPADS